MSDLDHNVSAQLLAIKAKKDAELASQQPAPEPIIEPKAVEAVPTTKLNEVKAEPEKVVDKEPGEQLAEKPENGDEVEFKWDDGLVEAAPVNSTIDIKKLGSAFELNVTSEAEFVKEVNSKLAKLKELETESAKTFEGVPTSLKEAIDIAKKGGDWHSFVENSVLDVTKLDAIDLFEQEYERQESAKYRNPDGTIDYEKLDEAMDSIPDAIKSMQGNQIKNSLYLQQQQKKQEIVMRAQQAQEAFSKQLGEAVKELPEYFPKDTYGIAIEGKHISSLYDGVASNKLIQKHLGNLDPSVLSQLDAKKLIKTLAMAEWGAGISQAQYKRGIVSGKRELLDKTQNAQINSSSRSAEPELNESERPISAAEKLKRQMTGLRPQGSL